MKNAGTSQKGPLLVVTAAAIAHPAVEAHVARGGRLVVAGDDPIRMSLAGALFPQAGRVWTNLSSSAQVNALAAQVGPCDGFLHLVAPGADTARETMVVIGLILAFLPNLSAGAKVQVVGSNAAMLASLNTLAARLKGRRMPAFCFDGDTAHEPAFSALNFLKAAGNPIARPALI
ncbi:hypothetical protein [Neogemmobacter tilapiae]|uniref:Uncharacterized protein n=1 Tax=Neogemmobacter tilapiae TaxID=875041 RepID=A0A918TQ57_9RHOB|nr:hypothetical protein [Gemmobacter tilapiae]GHC54656.1 hypothetical protein GCM10007315_17020 [Gemmobacter tilapiae]